MSSAGSKGDKNWPKEVSELYHKVEYLGKGAYGEVWKARTKDKKRKNYEHKDNVDDENCYDKKGNCTYVAIKSIRASDRQAQAYVKREVDVLSQIDHPHTIKLVNYIHNPSSINIFIVLSFADGPRLDTLLKTGGALGLPLARLVSRQLVSVVSYLHTRAVIHRDIKPDNIMLVGASLSDDNLWKDDDAINVVAYDKWKVILLDFGLSRALYPDEVDDDLGLAKIMSERKLDIATQNKSVDEFSGRDSSPGTLDMNDPNGSRPGLTRMLSRRVSVSGKMFKRLSAVGSKSYAAPEIISMVRDKSKRNVKHEALTDCVADYGMVVDAFSVGSTLREVLTGVPPNVDFNQYVMQEEDVLVVLGRLVTKLFAGCKSRKGVEGDKQQERVRKFRGSNKCPKDAVNLIQGLVKRNPKDRMTVREAQNHPWIAGGTNGKRYDCPQGDVPSGHGEKVIFLNLSSDSPTDLTKTFS